MTDTTKDPHADLMVLASAYGIALLNDTWIGQDAEWHRAALDAYARTLTDRITGLEADNLAYIKALAECRDVFPAPPVNTEIDQLFVEAIGMPECVPAYVRAQIEAVGAGGVSAMPANAQHWHDLYHAECLARKDDAARYGAEIVALEATQPAPAVVGPEGITLDFKQVSELLEMFGGEPAEITIQHGEGHSGKGLYAYYTDLPEEGAEFLGVSDDEALPVLMDARADKANSTQPQQIAEPASDKITVVNAGVKFGQFLSDVVTAAGLVEHGGQCKALGKRLAKEAFRIRADQFAASLATPKEKS